VLRQYFAAVQNLSSCCLPSAYGIDRGLKHYILYCLENDNFKTAYISPVSTEWIVLVWFIKYVVIITIK